MNKEQQRVAFEVFDTLHIGCADNLVCLNFILIGNPADVFVRHWFKTDLNAVFIEQTVLQNVELKDTDNADDDLFHTGVVFLEDLDGTFLGNLGDTFDELLTLHGIYLTDFGKMLRCESRNTFKGEFLAGCADGISDGENTRVKDTDDISGIGFADNLTFLSHQLLRLGKTELLLTLYVINFFVSIKLAGTDTHESDSVAVCLIHIGLDLEYKS